MSVAISARTSLSMPMPPAPARPRTVVVDDSPTILHAICSLLEHRKLIELIGRAESGPETITLVGDVKPDLVLMDADMPGMSGLRASLLLTQTFPGLRIVLMSMDYTPQFQRACEGCGAYAVIYKPKFLSELYKLLNAEPGADWRRAYRQRRKLKAQATIMR